MNMLDGSKLRGSLVNVNPRMEKHGPENKLKADLKLMVNFPNDVLDKIEPGLLASLYRAPVKSDAPELFDGTEHAVPLRVLKFPRVGPLSYESEFPGYSMIVHLGVSGAGDIVLDECTVDKMVFDSMDGGTVALTFRVVIAPDITKGHLDALCGLIQSEIEFTLTPPTADGQASIDDTAAKAGEGAAA